MYETKPYFYGTGRRKHSVARVRVYNGTGKMTINGRDINDYFGLETLKLLANSPLVLTENEGKFDVVVNVVGGGCAGQGSNPVQADQCQTKRNHAYGDGEEKRKGNQ